MADWRAGEYLAGRAPRDCGVAGAGRGSRRRHRLSSTIRLSAPWLFWPGMKPGFGECARQTSILVHGSGDVFAALFFHHWLEKHDTREALSRDIVGSAVVKATLVSGSRKLSLIAAQDEFTNPSQLFAAEAV